MSVEMPGAISISRLQVYDTTAPDKQKGGTPHMHFACTEMYVVLAGHGRVEFIDHRGFSTAELTPGAVLVFTPGTIHRLINPNSDLQLLVIMQNRGLPESGDAAVCFEAEYLTDADTFNAAMHIQTPEEAAIRRNRGVAGFLRIKQAFERSPEEGQQALEAFYAKAMERVLPKSAEWEHIIQDGAMADARTSLERVQAVAAQDISGLLQADHSLFLPEPPHKLGFCGILDPLHGRKTG